MERKFEVADQKDCTSEDDQVQMEERVDLMEAGESKAAVQDEVEEGEVEIWGCEEEGDHHGKEAGNVELQGLIEALA